MPTTTPTTPLEGGYSSFQYFLVTLPSPHVAHVEINRPQKLNAFIQPMWLELRALFHQISGDARIRAVVLSGAGDRAFCAGLDVQAAAGDPIVVGRGGGGVGDGCDSNGGAGGGGTTAAAGAHLDTARRAVHLRRHIAEFQDCVGAVERCEKPVICLLHGISYGLAIDLACCADIRLCVQDTRFAVKEVDIGLAADIGTLSRLPKAVASLSWVKDVCLSARDFGADEALAQGFVSRVLDSKTAGLEAALRVARTLAAKSPVAAQGTKALLNHARDHSVADSLQYTAVWNSAAIQSDDLHEALHARARKTKPKFSKL